MQQLKPEEVLLHLWVRVQHSCPWGVLLLAHHAVAQPLAPKKPSQGLPCAALQESRKKILSSLLTLGGGSGHLHRRLLSSTDGLLECGIDGQRKIHRTPCGKWQGSTPVRWSAGGVCQPPEPTQTHLPHEHEEEASRGHESSSAGR